MGVLGILPLLFFSAQGSAVAAEPRGKAVSADAEMLFVMEDGAQPPSDLAVFTIGNCSVETLFGSGKVFFKVIDLDCRVVASAPGIRTWRGSILSLSTVVLKRLGEREGSAVSYTNLKAPAEARKAYNKAANALLRKKYRKAIEQFQKATDLYPDYSLAWSEMARAQQFAGDLRAARQALHKAIAADPKYIKPYVQLAALEAGSEQWDECLKAATKAIDLNAIEFPGAFYYRAQALVASGNTSAALFDLNRTVQLDSQLEFPQARLQLAEGLAAKGETRSALMVLDSFLAVRQAPAQVELARRLRARIQLKQ